MYKIECQKKFPFEMDTMPFEERCPRLFIQGKKKVVYFKNEFDNSTFRYRCINFCQAMEKSDDFVVTYFLCKEIPRVLEYIDNIDIVILQRATWTPDVENLIFVAKRKNIPVVYDMDDLFFNASYGISYIGHIGRDYTESDVREFFGWTVGYEYAAKNCDAFIATVTPLKEALEQYFNKPAFVIPNFLNNNQIKESEYVVKNREYSDERFRIGYFSGSHSHLMDFKSIQDELIDLLRKYPYMDIVIVGFFELEGDLKVLRNMGRVIFRKFVPYQELQYEIGMVDVNVVPLTIDTFNEAKSELKFFEAGIVKVPSCVAPTKLYKQIVKDGVNGFVCEDGEWFKKIEKLYLDKQLRKDIAEAAYQTACDIYLPERQAQAITDTYNSILNLKK